MFKVGQIWGIKGFAEDDKWIGYKVINPPPQSTEKCDIVHLKSIKNPSDTKILYFHYKYSKFLSRFQTLIEDVP